MSGDWMQVGVDITIGRADLVGYVEISSDLVKILLESNTETLISAKNDNE